MFRLCVCRRSPDVGESRGDRVPDMLIGVELFPFVLYEYLAELDRLNRCSNRRYLGSPSDVMIRLIQTCGGRHGW
jgi:hypothetical protein